MAADDKSEPNSGNSNTGSKSKIGIPTAFFVDDVDMYMKQPENETADIALQKLDEQHKKYKFMEVNLMQKKKRLKQQVPDIKQTLDILRHVKKKKESEESLSTRFLLADQLYCQADVPPTDRVCLWLGANVMLEYSTGEAETLLAKNHQAANESLAQIEEDLDFIRDQYTTTEVNMARVYNWDVKRRQALAGTAASASTS